MNEKLTCLRLSLQLVVTFTVGISDLVIFERPLEDQTDSKIVSEDLQTVLIDYKLT